MRRLGYTAIAISAVLWAFGGALASFLIDQGASFVELTEARAWLSAAGLAVIVALRRRRPGGTRPRGPGRVLVVAFGLSIAAANFFYYASLSRLPVAVAITVQYTAPGLVVAWTAVAARRRPSSRLLAALALALAGVALLAELPEAMAAGGVPVDWTGFTFAIAAAVAFATYMVAGERMGRALGSGPALLRGFAVASVFWLVVQASRGVPETLLDPQFIPWVVVLAVVTTIAPFTLFVWGLGRVDASRAGIVSTLEPLTAALIAFAWLGQTLSGVQLAGAAMVVAGIGFVQTERPQDPEVLAERAAVE